MTQVLTPSGYIDASTLQVGDSVCAFDENTGAPITNTVERFERWQIVDGILKSFDLSTGEEIGPQFAEWKFYRVNGTWTLFCEQSIWRNGTNVCHAKHLVVGDEIYDDADAPVAITSVEEITSDLWYRFDISGDHSYIADGLTFHNASRFCRPGAGTADWTAINTGIWAASTAGATGQSVPGSADAVTCDANFGGGTCRVNFGGDITIQSMTCGAMTGTLDNSVFNNNFILTAAGGWAQTGTGVRTIALGSANYKLTSTSASATNWSSSVVTSLTFTGGSATVEYSGTMTLGSGQSFNGGGLAYGGVTVSGSRKEAGLVLVNSAGTISTLSVTADALVSVFNSQTIGVISRAGVALELSIASATTLTITTAPALAGTSSTQSAILNGSTSATATAATISCASGAVSGDYFSIQGVTFSGGATFTFTNSFDLGKNSGATITAPSAGGGGLLVNPGMSGGMA